MTTPQKGRHAAEAAVLISAQMRTEGAQYSEPILDLLLATSHPHSSTHWERRISATKAPGAIQQC